MVKVMFCMYNLDRNDHVSGHVVRGISSILTDLIPGDGQKHDLKHEIYTKLYMSLKVASSRSISILCLVSPMTANMSNMTKSDLKHDHFGPDY